MPTYEYLCQTCSHRFDVWQKMIDEALTICPECGGPIRRVYHPAGIVFKGSGFYKTDHGKGSLGTNNGETKKTESTSTETQTASESKPAASKSDTTSTTSSESKTSTTASAK